MSLLGVATRAATNVGRSSLTATAAGLRAAVGVTTGALDWYERTVYDLLGVRIDERPDPPALSAPPARNGTGLQHTMGSLLERSNEQTTNASRQELFAKMFDQIVPDEARVISALSDGSSSTLIHVYRRTAGRGAGVPMVENVSLIGRTANLALPHLTPNYVGHLLALGLLEIGPEDGEMKAEYEILAAEMAVLTAIKNASRGAIGARIERRTIRLSILGRELWASVVGEAG